MWRIASMLLAGAGALAAQHIVDRRWRELDDGRLEVHTELLPEVTGEWVSMFPGLLQGGQLVGEVGELGLVPVVPLLLHGAGGAAALDEAGIRLQKLGVQVVINPGWVRDRIGQDPLRDLLLVRRFSAQDLFVATFALGEFIQVEEGRRDPFVTAAAAEAWADNMPEEHRGLFEKWLVRRDGVAGLARN